MRSWKENVKTLEYDERCKPGSETVFKSIWDILSCMVNAVDKILVNYKTDLSYDAVTLTLAQNETYIWVLYENGTRLCREYKYDESLMKTCYGDKFVKFRIQKIGEEFKFSRV